MDRTPVEPLNLYLSMRRARDAEMASLLLAFFRLLRLPQAQPAKLALR